MSFCRNTYHLQYTVSSPYHLDTLYHPLITSVECMATYLLLIFPCVYHWHTKSLQYHCQHSVSYRWITSDTCHRPRRARSARVVWSLLVAACVSPARLPPARGDSGGAAWLGRYTPGMWTGSPSPLWLIGCPGKHKATIFRSYKVGNVYVEILYGDIIHDFLL